MFKNLISYLNHSPKRFFLFCLMVSAIAHFSFSYKSIYSHLKADIASKTKVKERRIKIKFSENTKKENDHLKKQIVNDDQKGVEEKSKDAKFLGKSDNKVNRETKASIVDKHKVAGAGTRNGSNNEASSQKFGGKKSSNNKKRQTTKPRSNRVSLSDLSMTNVGNNKKIVKRAKSSAKGLKNGKRGIVGLAQNNDFLETVKLGDITSLNTIEYKFYGYYHRIRQKLEQYWGNSLREKAQSLYRQGRSIASNSKKMTYLTITLNKAGEIVKIHIKSTSGVKELDDAAIESFNKAGPFPNPPKGMVENGSAKIEWGFVVNS